MTDISESESSAEDTDDEAYESTHSVKEQGESLLRFRLEMKRIKAGGRSTSNVHQVKKTQENFEANLDLLSLFMPDCTVEEYSAESINLIPWPVQEPIENPVITIS